MRRWPASSPRFPPTGWPTTRPLATPTSSAPPTWAIWPRAGMRLSFSSRRRCMRGRSSFEYAVIRVVPHVERGEFINAGVVLYCRARSFLDAHILLDEARLRALAPATDPGEVTRYLEAFQRICRGEPDTGPIGKLTQRER